MKISDIQVLYKFTKPNPLKHLQESTKYSEKECLYAMQRCFVKGYISYNTSINNGFLTEKGIKYITDYDKNFYDCKDILETLNYFKECLEEIIEKYTLSNKNKRYLNLILKFNNILINRLINLQKYA